MGMRSDIQVDSSIGANLIQHFCPLGCEDIN